MATRSDPLRRRSLRLCDFAVLPLRRRIAEGLKCGTDSHALSNFTEVAFTDSSQAPDRKTGIGTFLPELGDAITPLYVPFLPPQGPNLDISNDGVL